MECAASRIATWWPHKKFHSISSSIKFVRLIRYKNTQTNDLQCVRISQSTHSIDKLDLNKWSDQSSNIHSTKKTHQIYELNEVIKRFSKHIKMLIFRENWKLIYLTSEESNNSLEMNAMSWPFPIHGLFKWIQSNFF